MWAKKANTRLNTGYPKLNFRYTLAQGGLNYPQEAERTEKAVKWVKETQMCATKSGAASQKGGEEAEYGYPKSKFRYTLSQRSLNYPLVTEITEKAVKWMKEAQIWAQKAEPWAKKAETKLDTVTTNQTSDTP